MICHSLHKTPHKAFFKFTSLTSALFMVGLLSACQTSHPINVDNSSGKINPTPNPPDEKNLDTMNYPRGMIDSNAKQVTGTYVEREHGKNPSNPIEQTPQDVTGNPSIAATEKVIADGKDINAYPNSINISARIAKIREKDKDFLPFDDNDRSGLNKWGYIGRVTALGTNLNTASWGLSVATKERDSRDKAFAQGFATNEANLPTGSAKYKGRATLSVGEGVKDGVKNVRVSDASFNVDFSNKSLTGEITASNEKPFATENNNFNPISLKAKIKGNKFEGENAGMSTKGQFYGKDAGELAGTFANKDKNIIGAYGARKQGEGKNVEPNKPNEEARTNTYGHIVDLSSTNSESSSSNPDYEVEHYDIEKQKQTISALKTVTILMKGDAYKHDRYDEDGEEELLIRKLVDDLANPKERARLHEYADKGFVYVWPNVAIVGENLSYGQWGVTRIGIPDSMPKGAHIVGDVTDESQIPAQGNAVYQGLAGFYMVNKDKDIKYTYPGTVKADVNFAEKKLTAVVTPDGNADFIAEYKRKDISPIELTAQIKGANFVGTNPNNGITTKGLFLGPNAAEIVGTFNSSKPTEKDLLLGAFGAKKQN